MDREQFSAEAFRSFKGSFLLHVVDKIVSLEHQRLLGLGDSLIQQYCELTGKPRPCAISVHGQLVYGKEQPTAWAKGRVASDAPASMEQDLLVQVKRMDALKGNQKKMANRFAIAFTPCTKLQDLRDVLPDLVLEAAPVADIMRLPRTREPGYTLDPSSLKRRKFEEALDLAFLYLTNKMVF